MYNRQRTLTRYGRAAPPASQSITYPAPVGGINAYDSLMQMPPTDCIYTYNLMPVEYGLRLRKGYLEWATGCQESPARGTGEVRTIIPYESNVNSDSQDRIFAVTDEGIWNVSNYAEIQPAQVATFSTLGDTAGRGVYCEYTGAAADAPTAGARGHYLFYADGLNGIWQYEEATGVWSRPPSGTAPTDWYYIDPSNPGTAQAPNYIPFPIDDVAYVMVFKQRIWVILENDDDAFYLPPRSISGKLTRFTFGSKLPHGGNLIGLWTWSLDGGAGIDDYLVAISRGGDVVVYQGTDPEIDLQTRGAWFIGEVPESRNIVVEYAADLFVLSTMGLTSIKSLLSGAPVAPSNAQSPSSKINRFLRDDVVNGKDLAQWQLTINPSDGFMQIVTPTPTNTPFVQYAMNLNTGAWGMWQDVPMTCGYSTSGKYFMGASTTYKPGTVLLYDGALDGTTLPGDDFFVANNGTNSDGGSNFPYWAQDGANQNSYTCTDVAGIPSNQNYVEFQIDIGQVAVVGQAYRVTYSVRNASANARSAVSFGGSDFTSHISEGNGRFTATFTATQATSILRLIGLYDANQLPVFTGQITDIEIDKTAKFGEAIEFSTLTAFQSLGEHARFKRVGIARTIGVLAGTASFNVEAVYDYKIETRIPQPGQSPEAGINVWDSAVWDSATWDFDVEGKSFPVGVLGIGRAVAVGIRGDATTRINVVGWDMLLTIGGYL